MFVLVQTGRMNRRVLVRATDKSGRFAWDLALEHSFSRVNASSSGM